jgi:anti-sigma factor RsiW
MTTNHCESLDAYLDGELSAPACEMFERHLSECEACQRAVALDENLDQLLAAAPVDAPPELTVRIRRNLQRARLVRIGTRTALLAASIAAVALGIWSTRRDDQGVAVAPPAAAPRSSSTVHIAFAPEQKVIAMPLKSKNPRVSIVWVYPAIDANAAKASEPEQEIN